MENDGREEEQIIAFLIQTEAGMSASTLVECRKWVASSRSMGRRRLRDSMPSNTGNRENATE